MKTRNLCHWQDGGTGITNFHKSQYRFYRAVILICGDKCFTIRREPMFGRNGYMDEYMKKNYFSLHCSDRRDTSNFFKVLEQVLNINTKFYS